MILESRPSPSRAAVMMRSPRHEGSMRLTSQSANAQDEPFPEAVPPTTARTGSVGARGSVDDVRGA